MTSTTTDPTIGMIDSGANISLGPLILADILGLQMVPHNDSRKIGTASESGTLIIVGWIFPRGYTGPIALVHGAKYILFGVSQLQKNHMGVRFPPAQLICLLTVMVDNKEEVFLKVDMSQNTHLYFIEIRKLMQDYVPEYVQFHYYNNKQNQFTPNNNIRMLTVNPNPLIQPGGIQKRKHKPTIDVTNRVWDTHFRMNHTSLNTIAEMLHSGAMTEADCTDKEVILVRDHQDCLPCAIAKWKALNELVPSGITPNITGAHWSMDVQGPYRVKAIGGFIYEFLFLERSCGYITVFLAHNKTEAAECVKKVNTLCIRFGHVMRTLRVDMGTVESSKDFLETCHTINAQRKLPGIEVNPANVNEQQQNPVERYKQTFANNRNSLLL